jgi:hypothetical protein
MNALLIPQRTNTILYCQRWLETVRFYKDLIGFPVFFENDWFVEFQLTQSTLLSIANTEHALIRDVQEQVITLTREVVNLEQVNQT